MPGFSSHYLFGVSCYHEFPNCQVKTWVRNYHCSFSLGLQGPDIFFYSLYSHLKHKINPGVILHNHQTGLFLKHLRDSLKLFPDDSDFHIGFAYYAGFLCHYTLDRTCHPFVYGRTDFEGEKPGYFGNHAQLETDIDSDLLWHKRQILPSEFCQAKTLFLSPAEASVIASMVSYAYDKTFPNLGVNKKEVHIAILAMHFECHLMHDPYGWKKSFVKKCESIFLGYPFISAVMPSDRKIFNYDPCNRKHQVWHSPWVFDHSSTESFYDLYEKALNRYKKLLPFLEEASDFVPSIHPKKKPLYHPDILKGYSFTSGLPHGALRRL